MDKNSILKDVENYASELLRKEEFVPFEDEVPVSGASITPNDIASVVDAVLNGWFTEHETSKRFEQAIKEYLGVHHVSLCNSGSSASLLATTALNHTHPGNRNKSHLVITCATGFPTTVFPIYQNNLVPLFVDSKGYKELNADVNTVLELLQRKDVCGVSLAHTLGFPFRADLIREECDRLGKWFLEDCCDALGAEINGTKCGNFGHASTLSFFPAHQITTGEGGAVLTNNGRLHKLINSYRDWGRDCFMKGTPVLTIHGLKNIEDIKVGEFVFTHEGNFRTVINLTGHKEYDKPIVRVKTALKPEFNVSSSHPFLTIRNGNYEWVSMDELKRGDHLLEPVYPTDDFNMYSIHWKYITDKYDLYREYEQRLDPELLRLIGYYLAEGSLVTGRRGKDGYLFYRVSFSFHEKETSFKNDVEYLMHKYFNIAPYERKTRNTHGIEVSFKSRKAFEFFSQNFGVRSEEKRLPQYLLLLDEDHLSELLKGYWRGDGSSSSQGFSLHSVSYELINQMRMILLKFGIIPSFWITKRENKVENIQNGKNVVARYDLCNLNIYGINAEIFGDLIGEEFTSKTHKRWGGYTRDGKYVWYPIRTISLVELNELPTVYNLEVEYSHSYNAYGFAVHNCWCLPGQQNTCGKRFGWDYSSLPEGWDHKYTFTNLGYNLKITDMQSALGLSQIKRIKLFVGNRIDRFFALVVNINEMNNFRHIFVGWKDSGIFKDINFLMSPFGVPITVTTDAFTKKELVNFLESRKIRTRPVFGGNLTRQPAIRNRYYEQVGFLENSDYIMERTFWIGCWPGLSKNQIDFVIESFSDFFRLRGLL